MANRLKTLESFNYTGGLNTRLEAFQLADNEVPEILNMTLDPRGGVFTRRGWNRWNTSDVVGGTWNPRSAYLHELAAGTQYVLVSNGTSLYSGNAGAVFSQVTGVTLGATPHLVDYASWGDTLYLSCGRSQQAARTTGTGAGTLLTSNGPTYQNDYLTPVGGYFPRSEVNASHLGYMFCANTRENSVDFPNRLRWSHPNSPENWKDTDFLDVLEGGTRITGLVSFTDHLLIFKTDSVWALFGYDADTWNLTNITKSVGAAHQQAITTSEQGTFFYHWPLGVFRYNGGTVTELSGSIRELFSAETIPLTSSVSVFLGWVNRKLWVGSPTDLFEASANEPQCVFVYDPNVSENGGWTIYRGSDSKGLGPFLERAHAGGDAPNLAFARSDAAAVELDALEIASDAITSVDPVGFVSAFRTRWENGGMATLRKSWRRPDVVLRNLTDGTSTLNCSSYIDYDTETVSRSFVLTPDLDTGGATYGSFVWGDGSVYASGGSSTQIERASTLGLARALQLRIQAPAGTQWGVNAVIFKIVPKRLR